MNLILTSRESALIGRKYNIDPVSGYIGELIRVSKEKDLMFFKTVKNVDEEHNDVPYFNIDCEVAKPGDIIVIGFSQPYPLIELECNLN